MQGAVHLHAVLLHQVLGGQGVALALDALYLGQQLAYELAQGGVVVDDQACLALALDKFHGRYGAKDLCPVCGLLQAPMCYESTVAHMRLLYVASGLDAHELRHQTVEHVGVVVAMPCIRGGSESQVVHLLVGNVVEREEVGTCLLYGAAMHAKGIGIHARQELSRTVSEALVQVGMQVVQLVRIEVDLLQHLGIGDELLSEPVAHGRQVVGLGEVAYGNALASVDGTHPVAIGQVDAYGRTGIEVATQNGSLHHTRGDTLALLLLEARVHRAVVLEPLCILAEYLRAASSLAVQYVHITLPRSLQAQRVAIYLGEAVDEVHRALHLGNPLDGVLVEGVQRTGAVELEQKRDNLPLPVRLGKLHGLLQMRADALYLSPVEPSGGIYVLVQIALGILFQTAVHAVHDGLVGQGSGSLLLGIELLCLVLCDTLAVVVACRGKQEVVAALAHTLGHDGGVGDNLGKALELLGPNHGRGNGTVCLAKPFGREGRLELVRAIVMMYAVGKPHLTQVGEESLPVLALVRDGRVLQDVLQQMAYGQVVAAVLVPQDVASAKSRLCKVVDILLLPQAQVLEGRHTVAQQLYVGKAHLGVCEGVILHLSHFLSCPSWRWRSVHGTPAESCRSCGRMPSRSTGGWQSP